MDFLEVLNLTVTYLKYFGELFALVAVFIKPLREWLFGISVIKEGQRCLLRAEIVRIYYRHRDDKQLKEFEFKNLEACYKAYKALGGNSFIDKLYAEMQEWDII